jgi:signal transduction histidine kinase
MIWQNTPYTLPLLGNTVISVVLTWYIWKRRARPGALWLFTVMCGVVVWGGFYTMQMASAVPLTKGLLNGIVYVGILIVPTAWLAFCLDYTGKGDWFKAHAGWFVVVPGVTLLTLWTNPVHHWFWSGSHVVQVDDYFVLEKSRALGFWVHAFYSYTMLLVGNFVLLRGLLRSNTYRLQFCAALLGCLAPWAANALTIFDLTPYDYLDLTPFAFCITGLALGLGLFRFRLLDVRPLALDLAVERMRDSVFVVDGSDCLIDLNSPARSLLRSKHVTEPIGESVVELLPGLGDLLAHPIRGDVESMVTIDLYGALRSYEAQRISMQPQGAGWLLVLHDITTRQRTEDRLRQLVEEADAASRAKSHFLAHMNHELRNPLTSLMGHAEMLQMQLDGELNREQETSVEAIITSSEQLLAMINESLDMSRIEAGRVTLSPEAFDVHELVHEVAGTVRPLIERGGNRLQLTGTDGIGEIYTDRVKVRQCLLNLLTNAAKFTKDGEVVFGAKAETDAEGRQLCRFSVQDSGVGIDADRHEAVFEPFSQASDDTARRHGGTGLGLSIARSFARLLGGDIDLTSQPGEGSVFTLRLPTRMLAVSKTKG